MELRPEIDSKIDLYNLHVESQNISHTITLYDHEWHKYNKETNKLEAQIKNLIRTGNRKSKYIYFILEEMNRRAELNEFVEFKDQF